ncbi:MAG TPA: flagellar hook-basal body complex protein, partial [Acetobacteraceae bacterium]|nr:flagellar hook-basal body complex protein [Acetobacteraceae bacterium]
MGIFDALTTAVAGLQSQSFALQNISGNIANSQTVGYKETDTSFEDLVSQTALNQQTAGGVFANSTSTNTVGGTLQSSSISTNMAIEGDGWFVVTQPTGVSGNAPNFTGEQDYTRRGDFQLDDAGYLVNGAGYYLMGIPVDPGTGKATSISPQVLQFNHDFIPAQQTTSITYQANLPATPSAGVLDPSYFEANPINGLAVPAGMTGTGALLDPDALAIGTGTVGGLNTSTTLASLGIAAGQTITVNDGTNTTAYTSTGSDTVGDLVNAINAGTAAVTASLNPSGNLVLTGNNYTATIAITGSGSTGSALGFATGANTFSPVNLLTQDAVTQGQTLTVQVGGGATQTITFGTGSGQVATLGELQTQIQALTGVSGTVNTANGDISLTANSSTADIALGGTAALSKFGLQVANAYPANGTVIGADAATFANQSVDGGSITAYDSQGNPVDVNFRWAKINSAASGGT